jgi:hypothetical protein
MHEVGGEHCVRGRPPTVHCSSPRIKAARILVLHGAKATLRPSACPLTLIANHKDECRLRAKQSRVSADG